MNHLHILAASLICLTTLASPAYSSDDKGCELYGKIGGGMSEFILPLTLQDFVDMMTGKNPELLENMAANLLDNLDGHDILEMSKLKGDTSEIIGQAAGTVSVELLMSGQANNAESVTKLMIDQCKAVGLDQILENQRTANAATRANIGER